MCSYERTKRFDIPLSDFSVEYIQNCQDPREIEKIYIELKSGELGRFDKLEEICREKLESLNPNSRELVVEKPVKLTSQMNREEKTLIEDDILEFLEEITTINQCLKESEISHDRSEVPIRSSSSIENAPMIRDEKKSSKRCAAPRSYEEWSKLDKLIEEEFSVEEEKEVKTVINATQTLTSRKSNLADLLEVTEKYPYPLRMSLADKEKEKGNEAFKALDYDEAIVFYKRSIILCDNANAHNNLALIYLKRKKYSETISECDAVLELDVNNSKALYRRALALFELCRYEEAEQDLVTLTDLDLNFTKAQKLLLKVRRAMVDRRDSRPANSVRPKIQVIETKEAIAENREALTNHSEEEIKLVEEAMLLRDQASEKIDRNLYEPALKLLSKGISLLSKINLTSDSGIRLLEVLYKTRALCHLKLGLFEETLDDCQRVFQTNENCRFTLYRSFKANEHLKRYKIALAEMKKLANLEPDNQNFRNLVTSTERKLLEESYAESKLKESQNISSHKITKDIKIPDQSIDYKWREILSDRKRIISHQNYDELNSIDIRVYDYLTSMKLDEIPILLNLKCDSEMMDAVIASMKNYFIPHNHLKACYDILSALSQCSLFPVSIQLISDKSSNNLRYIFNNLEQGMKQSPEGYQNIKRKYLV